MTVVRQKELRELNILKILKKKQTMVLITLGFLDSIAMFFVTARPSGPAASLLELAVYMATNVLMNWEKCFRVDTDAAPSNSMQFSLSQCSPPYVFLVPIMPIPKTKLACRNQLHFLMESSLEKAKWLSPALRSSSHFSWKLATSISGYAQIVTSKCL